MILNKLEDFTNAILRGEKIHDEFINQDIVSIDNFHKLLTKITEVLK